jgi:hypothetical protein
MGVDVELYSFLHLGAGWWWVVSPTSRSPYLRERDPVPIVQEAEWALGARKISPTPGFDPRIVQPVTSHYTN